MTVADALRVLLADYQLNGRRSLNCLEYRTRRHVVPHLGHLSLADVTRDTLREYVTKRRSEGAVNGTIQREIAAVRRAFSLADAPWPKWEKLREAPPRQGFYTPEEFARLLDACTALWARPPLQFAYLTGWRLKSEVLPLRLDHVELGGAARVWIDPGTTKNGDGRVFPVNGELRALLERQRAHTPASCPWVFHRRGRRLLCIRGAFERARVRIGTPTKLMHDLRRTAARHFIRSGVPEAVAMRLGGWRDQSVFARYNVVSDQDLVDAAARIDRSTRTMDRSTPARTRDRHRPQLAPADLDVAPPIEPAAVILNVRVPSSLKRAIALHCSERGETASSFVVAAITGKLRRRTRAAEG